MRVYGPRFKKKKKKPSLCTGSKKKILKGCKQQKTDFSFLWLKGTELNERSEGARTGRPVKAHHSYPDER